MSNPVGRGDRDGAPFERARVTRGRFCEHRPVREQLTLGHGLAEIDRAPIVAEHLEGDGNPGAAASRRVLVRPRRAGTRQGEQGGKGTACQGPARRGPSVLESSQS